MTIALGPRLHVHRRLLLSGVLQLLVAGGAAAGSVTLAWDPSPSVGVSGYRVYVGVYPGQYSEWYDLPAQQTSFVVPSLQDGARYYFAVASKAGSVVGPRSEEVSGFPAPDFGAMPPVFEEAYASHVAQPSCQPVSPACASVASLGTVAGAVGSLSALPDGRVLVVEEGLRVRAVRAGAVEEEPAAKVSRAGARISTMAVDPRFPTTHFVVVGETRPTDRGRVLDVLRYRELNGLLGEPAAIVVGLPLAPGGEARLAVDEQGSVLVALPGATSAAAGTLLRFGMDGSVPRDNPTASPVLGDGPSRPRALGAVGAGTVWSIDEFGHGRGLSVGAATGGLSAEAAGAGGSATPAITSAIDGGVVDAAVGVAMADGSYPVYLVSDTGTLWRGTTVGGHVARIETRAEDGHVVAVSVDLAGVLYVAVRSADASDGRGPHRILKLADK